MGKKFNFPPGNYREVMKSFALNKGNCAFADLRYGEEDSISPSTLFVAATKG